MPPFSPTLMDHFLHPRRTGLLGAPDGEGWAGSIHSSRYMRIQIRIEYGLITDARFATYGCAPAIASGSWLCDWVVGKPVADALACTADALHNAIGPLPKARRFCADLAIDALRAALNNATTAFERTSA